MSAFYLAPLYYYSVSIARIRLFLPGQHFSLLSSERSSRGLCDLLCSSTVCPQVDALPCVMVACRWWAPACLDLMTRKDCKLLTLGSHLYPKKLEPFASHLHPLSHPTFRLRPFPNGITADANERPNQELVRIIQSPEIRWSSDSM